MDHFNNLTSSIQLSKQPSKTERKISTRNVKKTSFYIYDFPETNWYQACKETFPLKYQKTVKPRNEPPNHLYTHGNDIIFLERLFYHPWRVSNPDEADILILPFLFNYFLEHHDGSKKDIRCHGQGLQEGEKLNFDQLLSLSENFLVKNSNPSFLKNSKPHLIFFSHWYLTVNNIQKIFQDHTIFIERILPKVHLAVYETQNRRFYWRGGIRFDQTKKGISLGKILTPNKPSWRASVVVPYTEWPILSFEFLDELLTFERWKNLPIDLFFVGRIHHPSYKTRKNVCQTLKKSVLINRSTNFTYICAETHGGVHSGTAYSGKTKKHWSDCKFDSCHNRLRCSACHFTEELSTYYQEFMLNTKFQLIIHGDTASTSRLYDALTNGQIPIIISPGLYSVGLPFSDKIPWNDLAFFVPYTAWDSGSYLEIFETCLLQILGSSEEILRFKFENLLRYRKDISWLDPESSIIENILDDAREYRKI